LNYDSIVSNNVDKELNGHI